MEEKVTVTGTYAAGIHELSDAAVTDIHKALSHTTATQGHLSPPCLGTAGSKLHVCPWECPLHAPGCLLMQPRRPGPSPAGSCSCHLPHLHHVPSSPRCRAGSCAKLHRSSSDTPPHPLPAFAYILPANPCQGEPLYCLYRSQGVC